MRSASWNELLGPDPLTVDRYDMLTAGRFIRRAEGRCLGLVSIENTVSWLSIV